ncbi:hypothetical protein HDV05_006500 [Chytridiales sp. JEL 0842]|nr:hypothetical protein HDV05_006500 [Chytridiales sp. JEL 0842]
MTPEFMRTLGRGFFASVAGAGPQGGLRLSSYEYTKSHLLHHAHRQQQKNSPFYLNTVTASAVSAVVGDLASSIVKVPREVITARLQTAKGSKALSPAVVVRSILHEQGPLGLFRGFWSTTARDAPFMVILFCTYESMKQNQRLILNQFIRPSTLALEEDDDEDETNITTLRSTIFGGLSGALAGFCTTPFDVIKTKIMTSPTTTHHHQQQSSSASIFKVASEIIRQQRTITGGSSIRVASTFFTGATARSVWWFGICSIFFPIYEKSKEVLRNHSATV